MRTPTASSFRTFAILRVFGLACLVGAVAACGDAGGVRSDGRIENVVLISIDTLRADHLGCYGNDTVKTPAMDGLAEEGLVFLQYVSPAPTTLCSHTSLMTGTYPHTHGTPRNGFEVPEDNEMLAEVLKRAGFSTAGVIGAFPLRSKFDFAQGFDFYDDGPHTRSGDEVNAVVERFLEQDESERLFLFVHYWDAHYPYSPPAPYDRMYTTNELGMTGSKAEIKRVRAALEAGEDAAAQSDVLRALYAGGVSYVDSHVAGLLALLREHDLYERSLIVLTSDHGEAMDEHWEFWDHGESTYETSIHVPLIVRLPGAQQAGTRVDRLVSGVDVMPTILELLGVPRPEGVEGVSFAGVFLGREQEARPPVFSEATKPHTAEFEAAEWTNRLKCRTIRGRRWKLIERPLVGEGGSLELYDLVSDPGETVNLLERPGPDARARADELRARLREWSDSASGRTGEQDLSEETLRRLEELGYVEGQ